MSSTKYVNGIKRAAHMLSACSWAVAFTGAGISTPSGIPDFRSPETGLWSRRGLSDVDNEVASPLRFAHDPQGFYNWMRPLIQKILTAEPNPAHFALAELENLGFIHAIITQNADMLHQRAGSNCVIEVHGTLAETVCISCYEVVPSQRILKEYLSDGEVPRCEACGGVLKPNVIFSGEQLPAAALLAARNAVNQCDVMLIAGTSLSGGPATRLAELAQSRDTSLIIINLTPTLLDSVAEVVIRSDVAESLPAIVTKLRTD